MRLLMALVLLVPVLAGCAGDVEDFDAVEAPALRAGYAYAYDMEAAVRGTMSATVDGETEKESFNERLGPEPAYAFEIVSTRLSQSGEPFYLGLAQATDFANEWLDVGDGRQPMAIRHRDLAVATASLQDGRLTIDPRYAIDPYLDFPLTPGKQWEARIRGSDIGDEVTDESVDLVVDRKVVRMERVQVGNQSVEAVLVKGDISSPDLTAMAKEAEAEMRAAGMQDVRFRMDIRGSLNTWYAPVFQAVAREELRMTIDMDIGFRTEGHNVRVRGDIHVVLVENLVGADLTPQADRTAEAALAYIASGAQVRDPTGRLDAPSGAYLLNTTVADERINAAAGESFTFTVEAPGMPTDHTLRYRLLDASGKQVASGEASVGTAQDVAVASPGTYSLLVRAYSGDRLQAQDAVALVADWHKVLPVQCNVAAGSTQVCRTEAIPSGADLQRARITFAGGSANGIAPGTGTLILRDGEGGSRSAAASMGRATIDVRDLQGLDLGGAWTITWQPTVGVLEQGTFDVLLEYGPSEGSSSSGGMLKQMFSRLVGMSPHLDVLRI